MIPKIPIPPSRARAKTLFGIIGILESYVNKGSDEFRADTKATRVLESYLESYLESVLTSV